jgi:hypothetical protein
LWNDVLLTPNAVPCSVSFVALKRLLAGVRALTSEFRVHQQTSSNLGGRSMQRSGHPSHRSTPITLGADRLILDELLRVRMRGRRGR